MSTGECHSPQNKAENNHAQRRFQYKLNVSNGKYTHLKVIPYWLDQELVEKVDLDSAVK